ncbi:MAG TPA: permease-like cell division protein FtsX [Desulfosalsimonadaceae bacterium]|nr:permease-like cell division protein FtsX [Desulfosalsimonadaceae bacterium]
MIRFAFKRALRDIRNNFYLHMVCVVTISLAVFILSAFALFYINATELLDAWKQGARVIAYVDGDLSDARQGDIMAKIEAMNGVAGVDFVSREAAYESLKEDIGDQSAILEGLNENPLPDSFEIRLSETFINLDGIGRLAASIAAIEGIDDVEYAQKWLSRFAGVYNLFKITGLVLVAMFFFATLFIVANTIRLILYSRREEIEIMRIVGADEAFIKHPFYFEGLLLGFTGAGIGLGFLYLAYLATVPNFAPDILMSFFEIRFIPGMLLAGLVLCSMIIGWAGCHFSIKRFLKI